MSRNRNCVCGPALALADIQSDTDDAGSVNDRRPPSRVDTLDKEMIRVPDGTPLGRRFHHPTETVTPPTMYELFLSGTFSMLVCS